MIQPTLKFEPPDISWKPKVLIEATVQHVQEYYERDDDDDFGWFKTPRKRYSTDHILIGVADNEEDAKDVIAATIHDNQIKYGKSGWTVNTVEYRFRPIYYYEVKN